MRSFVVPFLCALGLSFSAQGAALPQVDSQGQQLPTLAPLVERVNPAVVNISTFTNRSMQTNPLLNDPFFRRFFNIPPQQQPRQQRRTRSAGSGVILKADKGIIVTNFHVIDGADEIRVGLWDGRDVEAKLIGSDPEVDIAVLEVDEDNLVELPMADSDTTRVGDFVIAIGNPFGLSQTVTTGVVSAMGRSGLGIEGLENFIQTDASINPGNSGGALVNLRGELVGINTAILAPAGGNVGIGFAIPINMARVSVEQILEHGEVQRGQLGVVLQDLSPDLGKAFELEANQKGVLIAEVVPDSPADEAGLEAGDILLKIDGREVNSTAQVRHRIGLRRVGDEIEIDYLRDGKVRSTEAELTSRTGLGGPASGLHPNLQGVNLQNDDSGKGVLVAGLDPQSKAAYSGLRQGDIIVEANRRRVRNISELEKAIDNQSTLLLRVVRANVALYLVIR